MSARNNTWTPHYFTGLDGCDRCGRPRTEHKRYGELRFCATDPDPDETERQMALEKVYRVEVEGGGSFLYDEVDVARFARRMATEGDTRSFSIFHEP